MKLGRRRTAWDRAAVNGAGRFVSVSTHTHIYICIHIYTHTHTDSQIQRRVRLKWVKRSSGKREILAVHIAPETRDNRCRRTLKPLNFRLQVTESQDLGRTGARESTRSSQVQRDQTTVSLDRQQRERAIGQRIRYNVQIDT